MSHCPASSPRKPRMLDLFCGAGGCAMGYHRAGFEVVGVDIKPQKRYPFEFIQADALSFLREHGHEYDAIHASPPCQAYAAVTRWRGRSSKHPDLLGVVREAMPWTGTLWVIENVREAPLSGLVLCGTMFGLPVRRHRVFESNVLLWLPSATCKHRSTDLPFMHKGERAFADAMGCQWMSNIEARQAIPPAYTEFLGKQLLNAIGA